MAVKSRFTEEEWQMVTDGPEWVFAALAAADGNVAITTKARESKAFKNSVKNFSTSSQLVKEVMEDETRASRDVKSATLSEAEQALQEINKILSAKASPADADQFRKFLTSVADSVAEAAGEGALGLGKKISKKEEKALVQVKEALKPPKVAKVEAKPVPEPKPKTKPEVKPTKPPVSETPKRPVLRPKPAKLVQRPKPQPKPVVPKVPEPEPVPTVEYIGEHTVASGETLSHISLKFYGSAVKPKYMQIYEANKDVIGDNPNIIKPGQVLKIPKLAE